MPQFDIFSFFSQLFWVFLAFLMFYLLICFYLLPALAAILKIRKRKLLQVSLNTTIDALETGFVSTIKLLCCRIDNVHDQLPYVDLEAKLLVAQRLTRGLYFSTTKAEGLKKINIKNFLNIQHVFLLYKSY